MVFYAAIRTPLMGMTPGIKSALLPLMLVSIGIVLVQHGGYHFGDIINWFCQGAADAIMVIGRLLSPFVHAQRVSSNVREREGVRHEEKTLK